MEPRTLFSNDSIALKYQDLERPPEKSKTSRRMFPLHKNMHSVDFTMGDNEIVHKYHERILKSKKEVPYPKLKRKQVVVTHPEPQQPERSTSEIRVLKERLKETEGELRKLKERVASTSSYRPPVKSEGVQFTSFDSALRDPLPYIHESRQYSKPLLKSHSVTPSKLRSFAESPYKQPPSNQFHIRPYFHQKYSSHDLTPQYNHQPPRFLAMPKYTKMNPKIMQDNPILGYVPRKVSATPDLGANLRGNSFLFEYRNV